MCSQTRFQAFRMPRIVRPIGAMQYVDVVAHGPNVPSSPIPLSATPFIPENIRQKKRSPRLLRDRSQTLAVKLEAGGRAGQQSDVMEGCHEQGKRIHLLCGALPSLLGPARLLPPVRPERSGTERPAESRVVEGCDAAGARRPRPPAPALRLRMRTLPARPNTPLRTNGWGWTPMDR